MTAIAWEQLPPAPRRVPLRFAPAPPARRLPPAALARRRRFVALVFLLVLVAATVTGVRAVVGAWNEATAGEVTREPIELVVEPGDTYWSLAERVHRGGDLRSTVDGLVGANGGRDLHVGDHIVYE